MMMLDLFPFRDESVSLLLLVVQSARLQRGLSRRFRADRKQREQLFEVSALT
jgi:hypothetical protein